jgi:putative ABC transport system permease protein
MNWLRQLRSRRRMVAEAAEEMRQHVAEKAAAFEAMGLSREDAERAARREFGNLALLEERCREVWSWPTLESLWADARFAVRQMRKSPAFAASAVLILALGVGVNASIFSVVRHLLLEPLPFPEADRLYAVWARSDSQGTARVAASGPDFLDYLDENRSFSRIADVIPHFTEPWTGDGDPRLVNCSSASEDFFPMLGIRPYLGRLYEHREYGYLENDTMVVSYRFWKNGLHGDPHVVGRVLHIDGAAETIVGVLPPLPDVFPDADLWPKLVVRPGWPFMQWRANKFLTVIGRVRPGVSAERAAADLTAILRRAPGEARDVAVQLVPLKDDLVGSVRVHLEVIMAAVALVLVAACVNVAALLLARSVRRNAELALRLSLGASRRRLAQQLTMEAFVLVGLASCLGLCAAKLCLRLLGFLAALPALATLRLPSLESVHLDGAALALTGAVAIAVTVVFGWIPAFALSGRDMSFAIRSARAATGRSHRRAWGSLVIAEIACSLVLAVGAGLLLRSFWRVQQVDPGFRPESMLTLYLRTDFYSAEGLPFWKQVLDEVAALPGVRATALADCTPGRNAPAATLVFGDRANDPLHLPSAQGCWISADFFRTSGTPLLRGRVFSDRDGTAAPPAVIVNAEAARRYWPGLNPLGRRLGVNYTGPGRTGKAAPRLREVVGVVADIKQGALDSPAQPAVYLPYLQDETMHDMAALNLFVRSAADPLALAASLGARIHAIRPDQPVENLRTMQEVVAQSLAVRRYSLALLGAFAAVTLLLAGLGVHGVATYVTAQRTRELGLRMALGATRTRVLREVLGQGLALAAAGVAIGAAIALPVTHALTQLLFEVSPLDPGSFAAAALLLAAISLGACFLPAWRASHLDPARALKSD